MPSVDVLLLLHAAISSYLAGLCWMVQVVHYPLFRLVDRQHFPEFARAHAQKMGFVVAIPMLLELGLGCLIVSLPLRQTNGVIPLVLLFITVTIWLSTFLLQVPCHTRLQSGYDEAVLRRLVRTNWIRTIGWTIRAALACWLIYAQQSPI